MAIKMPIKRSHKSRWRTLIVPYADAEAALAPLIAASRAGNCAMIWLRSASLSAIHRAISSSDRPQPMHIRDTGCTTQTRLQGDEMLVAVAIKISAEIARQHRHEAGENKTLAGYGP
jgi:hypothetical protein